MIILSIGSNLPSIWGNRMETLLHSMALLESKSIEITRQSAPYFSAPMGVKKLNDAKLAIKPADKLTDYGLPDLHYINITLIVKCSKTPQQLLFCLKQIEKAAGRVNTRRWASRPLDMDIIDYKGVVLGADIEYNQKQHVGFLPLALPHPGLCKRPFVLEPLRQIAPFWHHPINGETASQLLSQIK